MHLGPSDIRRGYRRRSLAHLDQRVNTPDIGLLVAAFLGAALSNISHEKPPARQGRNGTSVQNSHPSNGDAPPRRRGPFAEDDGRAPKTGNVMPPRKTGATAAILVLGSLWAEPAPVVIMTGVFAVTLNVSRLFTTRAWKRIDWRRVAWLAPMGMAGAALGAFGLVLLAETLEPAGLASVLRIAIGVLAVAYIGTTFLPTATRRRFGSVALSVLGAGYGFLSGLTGMQGLSRSNVLTWFRVPAVGVVGTAAFAGAFAGLTKLGVYGALGLLDGVWWGFVGLFAVSAWAGFATGGEWLWEFGSRTFVRVLQAMLAIVALWLVYRGFTGVGPLSASLVP